MNVGGGRPCSPYCVMPAKCLLLETLPLLLPPPPPLPLPLRQPSGERVLLHVDMDCFFLRRGAPSSAACQSSCRGVAW